MNKKITDHKTRQEKITMLKDLMNGKASLKDHRPHKCLVWFHTDEFYRLENEDLTLTEEEYRAYCRDLDKHYNTHHIILIDCSKPQQVTA